MSSHPTDDDTVAFETEVSIVGPQRRPRQMLADQSYDGHASVHDGDTADRLGLAGAPIEGPTHFSQFDPLAHHRWGDLWFETGCISAHFKTMVVEGDSVEARLTASRRHLARIDAAKTDGTPVLTGTASVGTDEPTELDERLGRLGDPGELFIVDQLHVGDRSERPVTVSMDMDTPNGELYPFSLAQKLSAITEPSDYYSSDRNPWGRPIVPIEMISVLAQKAGGGFAVRGPAVGLFIDLEISLIGGPVFVGQDYVLEREVVGLGQSRRTESSWVRTTVTDAVSGTPAASVLLHSGVFKESFAGYPADRL